MDLRIAIVGAGAIGGYFGAHMARAGKDVTLIDAWPENVETIRARGLRVEGLDPGDGFTTAARTLHIGEVQGLVREDPFDIAFIAVKSYDTIWATQLILPYLRDTGVLSSLQNSLNEPAIAAVAGAARTTGCAISALACELVGAAHVKRMSPRGQNSAVIVGEIQGPATPRIEAITSVLAHAETSVATDNLEGVKWSKLVINGMRNGLSAMTGMTGRQRDTDPVTRWVGIRLGGQAVRVGMAMGLRLENTGYDFATLAKAADWDEAAIATISDRMAAIAGSRSDEQRPSMGQDIMKGRRTETDAINGLIARKGREVGVDAELHQKVHEVILRIDRGQLQPSPANAQGL
jgi:2-dehydropantoate 2-reductase